MDKSYILSKKRGNSPSSINQVYNKNKKIFDELLEIKQKNSLKDQEILDLINKKILIPLSIFKNSSPLESIVKYLKDNLKLNFHNISSLLNRNERTIWVTYNNAIKKNIILDIKDELKIPVEIFSNRKLSVLENLVSYLKNSNYSLQQISLIINRDYKTIWTCYNRSKKKCQI